MVAVEIVLKMCIINFLEYFVKFVTWARFHKECKVFEPNKAQT